MIYVSIFNHIRLLLPLIIVVVFVVVPVSPVHAESYVWKGKTFETQEEMHDYIRAYMKVWRELHGYASSSTGSQGTQTTTTTSTRTRVSTGETKSSSLAVSTRRAEAITPTEARLVGRINFKTSDKVVIWFTYGTSPSALTSRTETETLERKSFGSSYFDRNVRGLMHDTKYYFRAVGVNEDGKTVYGSVKSLTTGVDVRNEDALINVRSVSAKDIDEDRATLRGTFKLEDVAYSYVWFEYGDEEDDLYRDTKAVRVTADEKGVYEKRIGNLKDQTRYYVRMVGQDPNGMRNYTPIRQFTTRRDIKDEKPKVTTGRVTEVGQYTATIAGSVDMNDSRNGIVFFVYGEDQDELRQLTKEYRRYSRIKERGDDLQKVRVDADLDKADEYVIVIDNLDLDTRHSYAIGLEYENEENDDVLLLGSVRTFTTKEK